MSDCPEKTVQYDEIMMPNGYRLNLSCLPSMLSQLLVEGLFLMARANFYVGDLAGIKRSIRSVIKRVWLSRY